jgi:hypothetical protein
MVFQEILNGVLAERHQMIDAATSSQTMEDLEGTVERHAGRYIDV